MKKILFVITGLMLGGAETQFFNLVSSLRNKFDVKVVNFTGGFYVAKFEKLGIPVKTIKVGSKFGFFKAVFNLKKFIECEKPDLVHSFLPHSNIVCKVVRLLSKLRFKLEKELKPGAKVIAHDFPVPGWKPREVLKVKYEGEVHKIFLYKMPIIKDLRRELEVSFNRVKRRI